MAKKLIMEASFEATPITGESISSYLENESGYVDIGGFSVFVPGLDKEIPFDFEATCLSHEEDGSYVFGNWDGFLERIFDVDPCHESMWAENGLTQEDITAELLASAIKLDDFYFELCNLKDEPIPCFLKVTNMLFIDENDNEFCIEPEVLEMYNKQRVVEQVLEYLKDPHLPFDKISQPILEELYVKKLNSNNPADILPIIDNIQNHPSYFIPSTRAYGDFLIDSLINVSNSKESLYRVALFASGNIDHDENPFELVPGTDAHYFYGDNIIKCQEAVLEYIENNDLGAGQWSGGQIFKSDEYIGTISYNGRFWNRKNKDFTIELLKNSPICDFLSEMNINMPMFSKAVNSQLHKNIQINNSLNNLIEDAEKKCTADGKEQFRNIDKEVTK